MSDFTQSTLTSPRSPLFSESDPPDHQSGSEIVTSDEEPDLGAFTAVLRAWGYLQPPLRIPAHFQSSSSSRTRSTPTTITGYPGFGGGDTETVEESTVWNRIPIQTYFDQSFTENSSHPTERAREVLEEIDDEESFSSPPPSPAPSEGARTVEIASETDAVSIRSVTLEDGISGERLVVPVTTPLSVDGRTVSVASGAESRDGQTHLTSQPYVPPSPPTPFGPRLPVINDNTLSSLTSGSPMPSHSYSSSTRPLLDDNTTISRQQFYPSTLSIVSYQPQITRTQSSVFQESPSPAFLNNHPFRETMTSSSPHILPIQSASRIVSNSSHAESDIINSYYTREPNISPPSTDRPASDFLWRRPLEIITQPQPTGPNAGHERPLLEQDSPSAEHPQTPSIIDDNSSTSAVTEYTSPPPPTTSAVLPALQPLLTPTFESVGAASSHSLTPHTAVDIVPAPASIATSTSTSTSSNTAAANPTRQSSLESSTAFAGHHPSLASTYREERTRTRRRLDSSMFQDTEPTASPPRFHLLPPDGGPQQEQPSLGYLDSALSFIAAERAKFNAQRDAGAIHSRREQSGEEAKYATESRYHKIRKNHSKSNTLVPATPTSTLESWNDNPYSDDSTHNQPGIFPSSSHSLLHSENADVVSPPATSPKKLKKKKKEPVTGTKPITILKRLDASGSSSNAPNAFASAFAMVPSGSSHSKPTNAHGYTLTHAHAAVGQGRGSPTAKLDGSATPRAHTYLYGSSSDYTADDHDEHDDERDENEGNVYSNRGEGGGWYIDKYGRRSRRPDPSHAHVQGNLELSGQKTGAFGKSKNHATSKPGRSEDSNSSHEKVDEVERLENLDVEREEEKEIAGNKKEKKKKKKVKKRKIPVTVPLQGPVTLSHSRSVPNLYVKSATTTDSGVEGTGELDFDSSGVDFADPAKSLTIPLRKKGKKGKGKELVDPSDPYRDTPQIGEGGFVQSKRTRLVWLARRLQASFPEELVPLKKVIVNLDGQSAEAIAEKKKKKKKSSKALLDDCSLEYSSLADSDLQRAWMEGRDPDPRGNAPGKTDTLVHVFIDHSNILFGLITYLKRLSRKEQKLAALLSKPPDAYPTQSTNQAIRYSGSRPLPIPKTKAGIPIPDTKPSIPRSSFTIVNVSRSAPSTSFVKRLASGYGKDMSSDRDEYDQLGIDDDQSQDIGTDDEGYRYRGTEEERRSKKKISQTAEKAPTSHIQMWHAALALILERGRPVTRRVVVTSSPLYQPMEDIEGLGYEVSILARVPDLGDGADRLEKAAKFEHRTKKDKDSNTGFVKAPSSPIRVSKKKTHVRGISTNMTSDTRLGSSAAGSLVGPQSGLTRVKYREQGVDELLQLKLHQAIAATDNVPADATIVLATGDGNVAQFNEDGYLGSVRYALKRGWKVELCAWEGGLNRSWRREFGPSSEWGRKGMFRIIPMEQFAECLVDLGEL